MADETSSDADVIRLARVRDKVSARRKDKAADELATRFHDAMGWKDKPPRKSATKKGKRKR